MLYISIILVLYKSKWVYLIKKTFHNIILFTITIQYLSY